MSNNTEHTKQNEDMDPYDLEALHAAANPDDESGSEKESPDHIDLGVAERFLENPDQIDLNGAGTIDDDAAEVLAKHEGHLGLNRLTDLSTAAVEALSKHQGSLALCGLTELSDAVAEALSRHHEELYLGLKELSVASAEFLSKSQGHLDLEDLENPSREVLKALSKHGGILVLGVKSLSVEDVSALMDFKGLALGLSQMSQISEDAAELLSESEAAEIWFDMDSMESLSPEVTWHLRKIERKNRAQNELDEQDFGDINITEKANGWEFSRQSYADCLSKTLYGDGPKGRVKIEFTVDFEPDSSEVSGTGYFAQEIG